MKTLVALTVLLLCGAADAARAKKRKPPAKTPPPAQVETAAAPPSGAGWDVRTSLALGAGGFWGGGANRGPAVGATVTFNPRLAARRFSLDLDLNWRMAGFSAPVEGYGQVSSTLHAFPFLIAARAQVLEVDRLKVDVRGGLGPLFLLHQLGSDFGPGATRTALGWEAFVAAQLRVPISTLEVMAEVRAGLGEAHIPFVLGRATGAQALVGVRYPLP